MKKLKIYVASSWRNKRHQGVVTELRQHGFTVYDFKHPNPKFEVKGFSWSDIDVNWKNWNFREYIHGLHVCRAIHGFMRDINAMKDADVCVLVLPCGRSAHLEAGYFCHRNNKKLAIYIPEIQEPELMYKMANAIVDNMYDLIKYLRKQQEIRSMSIEDRVAYEGCIKREDKNGMEKIQ